MKLLLVGDMHLRIKAPQRRTDDDFMETCLGKLRQVYQIAYDHDCMDIIQVGDFFDRPDPSKKLLAAVIKQMIGDATRFFTIHGQHDMAYHTEASMESSALRVLEAAGVLQVVENRPTFNAGELLLVGASFGQRPPTLSLIDLPNPDQFRGAFKVLVAHTMVGDKPLWPGQDLPSPRAYAKAHPGYDLYVLGDYHYDFETWVGKRAVINPGCLIRKTAAERDHKPKVVVFDTEAREAEDVYLDVAPASDVFDLDGLGDDKPANVFDGLTDRLKKMGSVGVSFAENLNAYFDAEKTPERIRKLIWQELEKE